MKLRIKFSKRGVIKYIGHLDLMRYFQKACRRTDIRVVYSKGFSPHMIMSFAAPLGVGLESFGEYFDVEVEDDENVDTITQRLNDTMADGIEILGTTKLPDNSKNAMASVSHAAYSVEFADENPITESTLAKFDSAQEIIFVKTTKTGEHPFNIKDYVRSISVSSNTLSFITDASSAGNLKPLYLLTALCNLEGKDIKDFKYHITREEIYQTNGEDIVPLSWTNEQ